MFKLKLKGMLKAELMIGYSAFFAWWAKPEIPDGATAFSYHRDSIDSYVVGLVGFLSVVEAAVVHALLRHWSIEAAWGLTGVSILGVVYLVGMIRSFSLRPALVDPTSLTLRLGFVRSVTIALADIHRIEQIQGTPDRAKDLKRLCLLQPANLLVTTASCRIACHIDEPLALIQAIEARHLSAGYGLGSQGMPRNGADQPALI